MACAAVATAVVSVVSGLVPAATSIIGQFARKSNKKDKKLIVRGDADLDGQKAEDLEGKKVWVKSSRRSQNRVGRLKRRKHSNDYKVIKSKKIGDKKPALVAVTGGKHQSTIWVSQKQETKRGKSRISHSQLSKANLGARSKKEFSRLIAKTSQEFFENPLPPIKEEPEPVAQSLQNTIEKVEENMVANAPRTKDYGEFKPGPVQEKSAPNYIPPVLASDAFSDEEKLRILSALQKMDKEDPVIQRLMGLGALWDEQDQKKKELDELTKAKFERKLKELEAKHKNEFNAYKAAIMKRLDELEKKKQEEVQKLESDKELLVNEAPQKNE